MTRLLPFCLLAVVAAGCIPDPGPSDSGTVVVACPTPTGSGTTHSTWPTASETWAASGNPHLVTADYKIAAGLKLTLEPCADVRMSPGTRFTIEGDLIAEGTATTPIRIAAANPAQPFAHLGVFAPGTLKLAWVTVANGGSDTTNSYGVIEARGDQLLAAQPILKVNNVAVTGAVAYGVSLRGGAAFTADSVGLSVSGAAKGPVRLLPRLLSNLPTGTYTGNTVNAVVVETEAYGDVTLENVTVHDRGVPYLVGGDLSSGTFNVGTGSVPVKLTIEPGVVMKFKKNPAAGLIIDSGSNSRTANGTLVAVGTAAKPIVFTSADANPSAGDWLGLSFGNKPTAANQLEFIEVRYAGGPSFANSFHCQPNGAFSANEDAAITLYGEPASAFLKNSTLANSAGLGVDLAYSGGFVDFVPTNTFTALVTCKVSYPRAPVTGACPATVPCP